MLAVIARQVAETGEEQIWTYSAFLDAYLEIGDWEAPVTDAKNTPSRAHKRLVMEMSPAITPEPEEVSAHR